MWVCESRFFRQHRRFQGQLRVCPSGGTVVPDAARTSSPLSAGAELSLRFQLVCNLYAALALILRHDFAHHAPIYLLYLWIDLSFTSSLERLPRKGLINDWRETFTHGCSVFTSIDMCATLQPLPMTERHINRWVLIITIPCRALTLGKHPNGAGKIWEREDRKGKGRVSMCAV